MTKNEVGEAIRAIILDAINRGHLNGHEVDQIFAVVGKWGPDPLPKPEVPWYNPKKVKRVGTLVQRSPSTPEQKQAAVEALRAVGLL